MSSFEAYINEIITPISCSYQEKLELKEELTDHLDQIEREYLVKGYSAKEAAMLAMERFGSVNKLQKYLKKAMSSSKKSQRYFFAVCLSLSMLLVLMLTFSQPFRVFVSMHFDHFYAETYISETDKEMILKAFCSEPIYNYNYIPLRTLSKWVINYRLVSLRVFVENILGNIILFIPLGFFLPWVFKRARSFSWTVLICLIFGLLIEFLQYYLFTGVGDIDDVILYTIGSVIGFIFYKIIQSVDLNFLISKTLSMESSVY